MASVVIGIDTETGQEVRVGDLERRSGLLILGKPRMGKSTLLVNLMLQDMVNGHGVFFLDPHGDATQWLLDRLPVRRKHEVSLLDPIDPTLSFGINLLACRDMTNLSHRIDTYTRAYRVFAKLWEESFGPWLQLIIENTLLAFLENPAFTLADVPRFLSDQAFRSHLIANMQYNRNAADFWREGFLQRREREQQDQIQAALTQWTTFLSHPLVRQIVGQRETTIDLTKVMEEQRIVLVRLSANLAPDIKKFIGTMLISELLEAIRNRPEGTGGQFCLFLRNLKPLYHLKM